MQPLTTNTLFTHRPDGSAPLVERFEYATALPVARSGAEMRKPLRAYPRMGLSAAFRFIGYEEAEALDQLRSGGRVLVPFWCHKAVLNAQVGKWQLLAAYNPTDVGGSVAVIARLPSGLFQLLPSVGLAAQGILDLTPAQAVAVYPVLDARLSEDSFNIEQMTADKYTTSLSFLSHTFDEGTPTWNGFTVGGLPLFSIEGVQPGNVSTQTQTIIADKFDAGHIEVQEVRYTRQTVALALRFFGAENILAYRNFLRVMQGRANAFKMVLPGESEMKTWRLTSDTVELQYSASGYRAADSNLSIVEVPA